MRVRDCKVALRRLLKQSGFDYSNPNPQQAWETFKRFAQEPVQANRGYTLADDSLLFQCGFMTLYDRKAAKLSATGEEYYLDFVRQFTMNDRAGDYSHMDQLHCEFTCSPNDPLHTAHTTQHFNLWSYGFQSLEAFFIAVEAQREFQVAILQRKYVMTIRQQDPC